MVDGGAGNTGDILALNAGSSSIKFALFGADMGERLSGVADGIGGTSSLTVNSTANTIALPDHHTALAETLRALRNHGTTPENLRAAAHRVVHGGTNLTKPARVTPEMLAEIAACTPLAPLHNPHNLAAITALAALAPNLPQYVSFDTSFHATNPEVATRYALPKSLEAEGIRRYGFHGLSYASLVQILPTISGTKLPSRLLAFHFGNGASLCAIKDGKSIATTMGYSPIDGLTMGTRAGGIDANAVLRLAEIHGVAQVTKMLNFGSGLTGLSGGQSDMRTLMQDPSPDATFAIKHFCYWPLRYAGSLIAAMEGLDAIAFTGGIGENATEIRARILRGLEWAGVQMDGPANAQNAPHLHSATSKIPAYIIPAQKERMIATGALTLIDK